MARRPRELPSTLAEAFGVLRSDYAAAKTSRFRRTRNVPVMGAPGDYHYRSESDYLRIMEYARDMDRNDVIVGATVDTAVLNTLQGGFQLDPATGDDVLDAALWARWDAWASDAERCDLAGEHAFHDLEGLAFRNMLIDGDHWALPNADTGALQMVEAHRVRTPTGTTRNVVNGVLLDDRRRRVEVWFTKQDVDPLRPVRLVAEIQPIPVRDRDGHRQVFQVYHPKRVSQTRGVSALAPIFDHLGMFEDINFAKLVQQQIVSCFAIFRQREMGIGDGATDLVTGAGSTETMSDGRSRTLEGIAPGMVVTGDPGERLEGFSPNIPNAEFFEHMKLILTLIGINLGLPLVLVMKDASETNFSGWRGAVDQARMGFRNNQQALARRFHRPVYHWKVREWALEDRALARRLAEDPENTLRHKWNFPTWPYIEPLKDASADLLRMRNALSSPRRIQAERGRDWEEVAEEIVQDNVYAIRLAKAAATELNAEFPDEPVHWREVLSLPTPDGVTVAVGGGSGDGGGRPDDTEGA